MILFTINRLRLNLFTFVHLIFCDERKCQFILKDKGLRKKGRERRGRIIRKLK